MDAPTKPRGRLLARLTLALISLVLAAFVFELYLRSLVPKNGTTPFLSGSSAGAGLDHLPYLLRPDFKTLYKSQQVVLNHLGFRGPAPDPTRKLHVALVGDSVTFGNCVAEDQTLAVHLERRLAETQDVQVLNCGIPGYNVENVVEWAVSRVLDLKPDVLVYVFVANDVAVSRGSTEVPPDAVIDPYAQFPLHSALLQFLGLRLKPLLKAAGLAKGGWVDGVVAVAESGGIERVREAVARLRDACRRRGIELFVVSFPYMATPTRNPFAPIERRCAELCRELDVRFADLVSAFEADENLQEMWSSPFDSHPSGIAHQRAAGRLAEVLSPCLDRLARGKE